MTDKLKAYEQTATILELLKDIPEAVHEHFCTKEPSCARHCGCKPNSRIDEKDITKCSLFSATYEENLAELEKRAKRNLLIGRYTLDD